MIWGNEYCVEVDILYKLSDPIIIILLLLFLLDDTIPYTASLYTDRCRRPLNDSS